MPQKSHNTVADRPADDRLQHGLMMVTALDEER